MRFLQDHILRVLLVLAACSVSLAVANAEPDACISREWAISIADPDVLDADSYGARTSIFLDGAGRPRIYYARGPVGADEWRIKSATQ